MANQEKKLIWKDEYSVGVKELDEQHRGFIEIVNELIANLKIEKTKEDFMPLITKLNGYKDLHFATEEKYFKEFNYEEAENHIKEHREFSRQVEKIIHGLDNNLLAGAYGLADYLEDWLIRHVTGEDKKYSKCFNEHGLF